MDDDSFADEQVESHASSTPLMGTKYPRFDGPLHAEWRAGDSSWSFVSVSELETVEEKLRRLREEGSLEAWGHALLQAADESVHGQTRWIVARAPQVK